MRKIGKLKIPEVKAFQKRRGIREDGKVGNQTWGEVLAIETENAGLKEAVKKLRQQAAVPPPRWYWLWCTLVGLVAGLLSYAWLF